MKITRSTWSGWTSCLIMEARRTHAYTAWGFTAANFSRASFHHSVGKIHRLDNLELCQFNIWKSAKFHKMCMLWRSTLFVWSLLVDLCRVMLEAMYRRLVSCCVLACVLKIFGCFLDDFFDPWFSICAVESWKGIKAFFGKVFRMKNSYDIIILFRMTMQTHFMFNCSICSGYFTARVPWPCPWSKANIKGIKSRFVFR